LKGDEYSWAPAIEPLSAADFDRISRLARERFGLDLKRGKEDLVAARLGKKMREHRFGSFREYYRHVLDDRTGEALIGLIDALTTNHTGFLREPAHFDFLRRTVAPALAPRTRFDLWCAACATGEEPYTICFSLLEEMGTPARGKARILASDISTRALAAARQGVYPADRLEGVPEDWRRKYFEPAESEGRQAWRVRPEVRQMVEFRRINLIEPLTPAGPFPVIFCRNVMIYFDRPTQEQVVRRLAERLEPGGYLLLGHAEGLTGMNHGLTYVRPAVYRRGEAAPGGRR
jgi:chemotaxis protein methyltransferase CheR